MNRWKALGIIVAVWTAINSSSAFSKYMWLLAAGGASPRLTQFLPNVVAIVVWVILTPPIFALSRRFSYSNLAVHVPVIAVVVALDGAVNMLIAPCITPPATMNYWQHVFQYAFINAFFYVAVVAMEHGLRYYRLYVERRIRASELETQLTRAQLDALQMQLRPHFFFNTLNTISGLIRTNENDAAIRMVAGLGDLLRAVLRSDGTQEVSVRQELDIIEHYLRIEQVRFEEQLQIEVTVGPDAAVALVPNLILQPLVENAVRHGIGVHGASGRVSIRVERRAQVLRLEVHNSGGDASRSLDRRADAEGGIGLRNTRARLSRLYGTAHTFELTRTANGAVATIEIPYYLEPRAA